MSGINLGHCSKDQVIAATHSLELCRGYKIGQGSQTADIRKDVTGITKPTC